MRSIETFQSFPLSAVKPLDRVAAYREFCFSATRERLKSSSKRRRVSPVTGKELKPAGETGGLPYALCAESGSLFLAEISGPEEWKDLLAETSRYRHTPQHRNGEISQSRTDNVYAPKLDWIRETLTLQEIRNAKVLEAATPPSDLSSLLKECRSFAQVRTCDEMDLAHGAAPGPARSAEAVVMLESLDRVDDPAGLLQGALGQLADGGLLFLTALVASGFDFQVLGLKNKYLYPPDRTNCFTLQGLRQILENQGFKLLEVSTPGVLDVEIVQAHLHADPSMEMSRFERGILESDEETQAQFQGFLQRSRLSSFARVVAKKA